MSLEKRWTLLLFVFISACGGNGGSGGISGGGGGSGEISGSPPEFVLSRSEDDGILDADLDSTPTDGIIDRIVTYTYDADGNRLSRDWESTKSTSFGMTKTKISYTYNVNGDRQTKKYDWHADGSIEIFTTYSRNSNGDVLSRDISFGGDFEYDQYFRTTEDDTLDLQNTYTYDTNGNQVKLVNHAYYNDDDPGEWTSVYTYTYDDNGNKLSEVLNRNSGYPLHDNPYTISYSYDPDGNLLTRNFDTFSDGSINSTTIYTYDADGNRLTYTYDRGVDGVTDTFITYTYDTDGNRLSRNWSGDDDGVSASKITYTYDSYGNELTRRYDRHADGVTDDLTTYTWRRL